jgi:hypothetical protein
MNVLQSLRSLPKEVLPASATVDFLHLIACGKSAVRTQIQETNSLTKVAVWCEQYGFAFQADNEGYVCVARDAELARRILLVDQSGEPHEWKLGNLLGYPACCCDFVAAAGEANIDALAAEIATRTFVGRFRLTNPTGYLDGKSLLCHLPCSSQCWASLQIAEQALNFIKANLDEPILSPWLSWLTSIAD